MGNLGNFDANTVAPAVGFEPVSAGKYPAIISDSEMKDTKANDGSQYLQLVFEIIGEQSKGRKLWVRLNLKNKNETAVKIAQAELSAICRAVGVMTPQDSTQLHNIPLVIDVGHEKNKETGDLQNKIKGFHPAAGAAHSAPVVAATVAAAGAPPPWAKK